MRQKVYRELPFIYVLDFVPFL